jgi:site-specific recombinase XerD
MKRLPLFDSINQLPTNAQHVILPHERFRLDFTHCLTFLRSYQGSLGTFNSYRREAERLLQWSWHIKDKTLPELKRDDIQDFIQFCQNPPDSWIGLKKSPRYIELDGLRQPNTAWRPFLAHVSKSAHQEGQLPSRDNFQLSQGAIHEIFAILSTLFNFLIAEEYLFANPVALIRQKSQFIQKTQQYAPVRRLSPTQWHAILKVTEQLAIQHPEKHERTRFMISLLYGMYLRISELAASPRWIPSMNDFAKDEHGYWWFTTVGKGNKRRKVAVSEAMLASLVRWRTHLGLSPFPSPADNS